jgi:hypothetical protein
MSEMKESSEVYAAVPKLDVLSRKSIVSLAHGKALGSTVLSAGVAAAQ